MNFGTSTLELKSTFLDDGLNTNYKEINETFSNPSPTTNNVGLEYTQNGEYNTLNESICISLKREFVRIWNKTQYAVIPRCSASPEKNLRQWDLWGPLFFTILLS